ncbi:MAG: MlaD family protein [Cyanobacteria bacterium P01_F01_bin.86]
MRARAIREGSVGLLILVGIGLFGGLVLWLRGLNPGNRNYEIAITFDNSLGMQIGTQVRYRGVPVGRVVEIIPYSNQIEVVAEITQASLRIPRQSMVAANQSGFIGETTIDITPEVELTETEQAVKPTARDCEAGPVICDGDRINGLVGVSYEALLRSAIALSNTLTDPTLVANLKTTLENTMAFTERATELTEQLSTLTTIAQEEIEPLSSSVQQATNSAAAAAEEIQITTAEARTLLEANRFNLTNTLDNISRGSNSLTTLLDTVNAELADREFIDNLEILAANAAAASVSLRDASADVSQITGSFNQSESLLLVQQTLASARDVFQSAQKILSDLDELTGDPTIRNNLRDLINGLTDLVSSTQVLEQQTELAGALAPLDTLSTPLAVAVPTNADQLPTNGTEYEKLLTQLEALANISLPLVEE